MATTSPHASSSRAELRARAITIPSLMEVAPDCLESVAELLLTHSFDLTRVCVASGAGPSREPAGRVASGLRANHVELIELDDLDGSLDQAADIAATIFSEGVTLVVAVCGGRVIDTAKLAAARTGTELISVPTAI